MTSSEPGSARALAHAWLAAAHRGGLAGEAALALTGPDFRLVLPRSLALADGEREITRERLAEVDAALRRRFDIAGCGVKTVVYDIFQGDRGAAQATLSLHTSQGETAEVAAAVTFLRDGERLGAVWLHADTNALPRP